MLSFGFIVKKYLEVTSMSQIDFGKCLGVINFGLRNDPTNYATMSNLINTRQNLPKVHVSASKLYMNLKSQNGVRFTETICVPGAKLPTSEGVRQLFEHYFRLALNDNRVNEVFLRKLYELKLKNDFEHFFIEVIGFALPMPNVRKDLPNIEILDNKAICIFDEDLIDEKLRRLELLVNKNSISCTKGMKHDVGNDYENRKRLQKDDKIVGTIPSKKKYYMRNTNFDIVDNLKTGFIENKGIMECIITGESGIGKSQILIEYCNRNKKEYERLYWISANNEWALFKDIREILLSNNIIAKNGRWSYGIFLEELDWFYQNTRHSLFIFDGARDYHLLYEFLPKCNNKIMISSPNSLHKGISIEKFDLISSREFIISHSGKEYVDLDDNEFVDKIVILLKCFPMALEQAGAYIKYVNCSFREYYYTICKIRNTIGSDELELNAIFSCKEEIAVAITYKTILNILDEDVIVELLSICSLFSTNILHEAFFTRGHERLPYLLKNALKEQGLARIINDIQVFYLVCSYNDTSTFFLSEIMQKVVKCFLEVSDLRWYSYAVDLLDKNFNFPTEYKNGDLLIDLLNVMPHIQRLVHLWDSHFALVCKEKFNENFEFNEIREINDKIDRLKIKVDAFISEVYGNNNGTIQYDDTVQLWEV